jgi:hypothetical protein
MELKKTPSIEIIPLKKSFKKPGLSFEQIDMKPTAYLYKVTSEIGASYFETFKRYNLPKQYSNASFSESTYEDQYPALKEFGITAFCHITLKEAREKFNSL